MAMVQINPYVTAKVRRAYIQVVGTIWMPSIMAAMEYKLSDYDLGNIGRFTRKNVKEWLYTHSGDFQAIKDFRAVCGSTEIAWSSEDGECSYWDCMGEDNG